jgi:signal transduction histidine kinase
MWVTGDPERLKAVFSNLLSNALKYTRGACQITVEPRSREALAREGRAHALAAGAPEAWLVIGVQDTSEGIAADDQTKLFQKFVRLPRSLTTAVRGTGLGLWICRQYLDAMGGDIWVESTLGKGSHFRFCLPLAARPADGRT